MKKFLAIAAICVFTVVLALYAAETPKVSKITEGIAAQGGTGAKYTNWHTYVVGDSPTNEYSIIVVTAKVTGDETTSSNTFSSTYLAAPTVVKGCISGAGAQVLTNIALASPTVDTTTMLITGMSTNLAKGVNNLPMIVYGYKRAGKFSQ